MGGLVLSGGYPSYLLAPGASVTVDLSAVATTVVMSVAAASGQLTKLRVGNIAINGAPTADLRITIDGVVSTIPILLLGVLQPLVGWEVSGGYFILELAHPYKNNMIVAVNVTAAGVAPTSVTVDVVRGDAV